MSSGYSAHSDIKEILLREGVLAPEVFHDVLKMQDKRDKPFLDLLIEFGAYDEKKFVRILAQQYGYQSVNPLIFKVESDIRQLVPRETAEKYLCVPITRYEQTLTIAFANPTNLRAIDEIYAYTGLRIKTAIAQASTIKKAIEVYYAESQQPQTDMVKEEESEDLDDIVKMIESDQKEGPHSQDTAELLKAAFDTPLIKLVNMVLLDSIRRRASDIFFEPWEKYVRVRIRVDGLLEEIIRPPKALGPAIISRIKIMSELNIAEYRIPQDGRFKVKIGGRKVDLRVSILPTSFGEKACLRILDTKAQSHDISRLGFSLDEQRIIKDCVLRPHGMILVTGPTGSGKTTTLYSVLKYLDKADVNITTVEDPVEYQLPGINQVQVKEHIGLTFPASLRSILRQDPDIILIGEIRDAETLDIAVKAALTGHLVLSTLHTNDATSSVTRMVNMGLEPFLIASTVIMISAQRLVRHLCPKCRIPNKFDKLTLEKSGVYIHDKAVFYRAKGCGQCRQTGYAGRSVITELLEMTPEIRAMIMKMATGEQIKVYAHKQGMVTLRECGIKKALQGETSLEEVFRVTREDQGLDPSTVRKHYSDIEDEK